jgi:hypothetical protein
MINWDEESDEWISKTFWLLWLTMAYLWEAMEYQEYLENCRWYHIPLSDLDNKGLLYR